LKAPFVVPNLMGVVGFHVWSPGLPFVSSVEISGSSRGEIRSNRLFDLTPFVFFFLGESSSSDSESSFEPASEMWPKMLCTGARRGPSRTEPAGLTLRDVPVELLPELNCGGGASLRRSSSNLRRFSSRSRSYRSSHSASSSSSESKSSALRFFFSSSALFADAAPN
jgi:hypothetical protein